MKVAIGFGLASAAVAIAFAQQGGRSAVNKMANPKGGTRASSKAGAPEQAAATTTPPADELLRSLAANRIAIEGIDPEIDGGRFPAKTVVGAPFIIAADVFGDGHDVIAAAVQYRAMGEERWSEAPLDFVINDRWTATLQFGENRMYEYTVIAWRDLYATWRKDTAKKFAAGQDVALEITEGREILEKTERQLSTDGKTREAAALTEIIASANTAASTQDALAILSSDGTAALLAQHGIRTNLSRYDRILKVFADRRAAAFSAWYELFPRSQSGDPAIHGTFDDVIRKLPYVRDLGFDVLYFPPIHPIGTTNRKGRNNTLTPTETDPGSPYAIGSADGGHDAIHPELGTFDDFDRLVAAAAEHGLEIAIDFAINCSPDHPWIKEHPEWFDWRPDGTIKFAENPPKKYEDIVNVHFYRDAIPGLWYALRDVVLLWARHGVKMFRVDNPHTKPLPFWEWLIAEVHEEFPDAVFLAEAFTRPKLMKRLAKVGYSQSYSYFTWRNEKWELEQYLTELTTEECRHYMRPNFFANTPDINPTYLQYSGRAGFQTRLVLAATLGGNYGIYNGFEISEAAAMPGKEEYLDSEKYEIRVWDFDQPDNIRWDIQLVNRLRREHPALQDFTNLRFLQAWNEQILYYARRTPDLSDYLVFFTCLDPHNAQEADFEVPLWEFGLADDAAIEVEDLVSGNRFTWHGKYQHIRLDPYYKPYAIYRLVRPGVAA